jgi:hypothetical protein
MAKTYHGAGDSLEDAIVAANKLYEIDARKADPSKDTFITKVVTFGVERGGFAQSTRFFANVEERPHEPA